MNQGIFVLIVGPTGSGKNVLTQSVREQYPDIIFPTSCTTRLIRPGEVDGHTYYFITEEEFKKRIDAGEFLEWARVDEKLYGTLKSEILIPIKDGKLVMREVEVQGVRQIREIVPAENLVSVYIDAGSWEELERRIRARAPLTEIELEKRKNRYEYERFFISEADFVVANPSGGLEKAKEDMRAIIENLRKRVELS